MVLLAFIAIFAGCYSRRYWDRLGENDPSWENRFRFWFVQGFVFPWLLWSLLNIGWGGPFAPLVPAIFDVQQSGQPWFGTWVMWSLIGALMIFFHWTAITYAWLLGCIIHASKDRKEVLLNILVFAIFSGSVAAYFIYHYGWTHLAAGFCLALLPIVHFTIDLADGPRTFASYSKATAQLKRGKYQDAEWEVISQLEKKESDFEGWMMLAELYATQYRNIEDAARVILDICNHPKTQPFQVSVACHKLADWQLEIAENPLGARAAMELLSRRLAGSHFAIMAEQRLRNIPRTVEEFDELKQPHRIRLPSLAENIAASSSDPASNDSARPGHSVSSRATAEAEANRLCEKLTDNPDDILTREKLASVLAEKLGKVALAVEQLSLLANIPDTTEEQKAKWLGQAASWKFNGTGNKAQFITDLRQIVAEFPQTSHAFAAQRRIYLMEMDFLQSQYAT